jgi:phosphatidylglycerophosphate synthase
MGDIVIFLETLIGNVNTMIGINRWLVGIVLMVLLLNGFKNLKAFWIFLVGVVIVMADGRNDLVAI